MTAALALLALASSAVAPMQFDLICTGNDVTVGRAPKATTAHYRVDMTGRQFCEADCETIRQLADVQEKTLTLFSLEQISSSGSKQLTTIDRTNGAWYEFFSGLGETSTTRGSCTVAPFSQFPTAKKLF